MVVEYKIIRSKRKTLSIIVRNDSSIEVRAPMNISDKTIDKFINEKKGWIQKKISLQSNAIIVPKYSDEDFKKIKSITANKVHDFLREFPGKLPSEIVIRKLNSSWGNCNSNGKITLNAIIGLLPERLFEYIMVHELCHLEYLDHSSDFWKLVSFYLPKYKEIRKELKLYKIK